MALTSRFILSIGYFTVLICVFIGILKITNNQNFLTSFDFDFFDALNYQAISQHGYSGYLVAFFPAFPALWYFLGTTSFGISLINGIIFSLSYSFLSHTYSFSLKQHLAFLTIPSIVFCFIPYSESLFFLFGVITLIGLKRNDTWTLLIGIFLCSLTRPIAFIFIPAIVLTFLFTNEPIRHRVKNVILSVLTILLGLFVVFLIQRIQTGKWLSFFEVQEKGWGNKLGLPNFPLSSWGGDFMVQIDGLALWFALIFGFSYLSIHSKILSNKPQENKSFIFSLCVISGTGLLILFTRGGSLFSLSRFVFASPFFIVGLAFLIKRKLSIKHILLIGYSLIPFSLAVGSYLHIRGFVKFFLISSILIIGLLGLNKNSTFWRGSMYFVFAVVVSTQLYMAFRILTNQWIG